MQINVTGTWRISAPNTPFIFPAPVTPEAYRELLSQPHWRDDWFRTPEARRDGTMIIRTRQDAASTLGALKIFVRGLLEGGGSFSVSLHCNPTRTLASRIAAYLMPDSGVDCDFVTHLEQTSPFGFFDHFGVTPSLDGKENWLPDIDLATELLGRDIFGRFFPIFVDKLMRVIGMIVAPFPSGLETSPDGTDVELLHRQFSGRLEWGAVRVPQIETYFERYHAKAREVVRSSAQAMLNGLSEARIRHHLQRVSWERYEDLFSIRSELPAERDLSVYAKSVDRLRFEITRPKRGRYQPMILAAPADRLMQIFRSERTDLLECCDWDQVAALFEEVDRPAVSDLISMVSAIAEECAAEGASARAVYTALLSSAGLKNECVPEASHGVLRRLERAGIIEKKTLRHRHKRGQPRYVLRGEYMGVFSAILDALNPD
ncbi:hypothetical protein TomTYG45_14130 [Sphingobium sp. TomTYG45]